MALMKIWRVLLLALVVLPAAAWAQPSATGVILMHGKWGTPDKGVQPIELELRGAGFTVCRAVVGGAAGRGTNRH
jgi:hypothetical protein